jgi:hypothetical protein
MLTQAKDPEKVIAEVVEETAYAHMLRYWPESARLLEGGPFVLLTDDDEHPTLLVAHESISCFVFAREMEGYRRIADDLFHERIEQDPPWPDDSVKNGWKHWTLAKGLFLNASPLVLWELMSDAGFETNINDTSPRHAYLWTIEGEPRFEHLIKHPCRLNEDESLWEKLREGIGYDEEGDYIRMCLKRGPSFVCEVDGEMVCWSATHLTGTMAMIYTPPKHRRKGYAKSLAAFQTDYMLKNYGVAPAHVLSTNVESRNMMRTLGARRVEDPLVWRSLYWPGEAKKAARRWKKIKKQREEEKKTGE